MKKTIAAFLLVALAVACDSAQTTNSNDSVTAPVEVDTFVPPVGIDTLITPEGDTLVSPIEK
jgi:hypothetical protein